MSHASDPDTNSHETHFNCVTITGAARLHIPSVNVPNTDNLFISVKTFVVVVVVVVVVSERVLDYCTLFSKQRSALPSFFSRMIRHSVIYLKTWSLKSTNSHVLYGVALFYYEVKQSKDELETRNQ